jgi:hypothetical protein
VCIIPTGKTAAHSKLADNSILGLLNHDWTAWRNQTVIDDFLKPLVQASL